MFKDYEKKLLDTNELFVTKKGVKEHTKFSK